MVRIIRYLSLNKIFLMDGSLWFWSWCFFDIEVQKWRWERARYPLNQGAVKGISNEENN